MVTINNAKQLSSSPATKACVAVLNAALEAVNPEKALSEKVRLLGDVLHVDDKRYDVTRFDRVLVVGAGKASGTIAVVLEKMLGNRITKGLLIDVMPKRLKRIAVVQGDHPVLSSKNVEHTKKILRMTSDMTVRDLVICVFSGGGSALFADPRIPLDKYQALNKSLLKSGASIQEFNTVRKHLDAVKGGRFASHLFPATVVTLLVSDVPGNDPSFIASGPTVRDATTVKDAQHILAKYKIPQPAFSETPKETFAKVQNLIFLDNGNAIRAMVKKAEELKLTPVIISDRLTGEAREVGATLLNKLGKRTVVIAAGETSVTVKGTGKGGRNQELVLGSVRALSKLKNTALASMGTDGRDNSDVAGALADEHTLSLAEKNKLDVETFLRNNDSYPFWKKIGKHIKTGATGTNVSDVMVAVRY
ncbi:DUF4147 domain-containing protein [Candidatus Woesearchaeota archaeon]|nr:DUF4147 domain-containing protein [Candidatus Woesearchaeota archaeon]